MTSKKLIVIAFATFLMLTAYPNLAHANGAVSYPANAVWIEPATIPMGSIGQKFNITVWANCSAQCGGWQFWLEYESTNMNATRVAYSGTGGKSDFFQNISTIAVTPQFRFVDATHNRTEFGEIWAGAGDFRSPGYGSLGWVEFEIIADGGAGQMYFKSYTGTQLTRRTYLINATAPSASNKVEMSAYGAQVLPEFNPLVVLTLLMTLTIPVAICSRRKRN